MKIVCGNIFDSGADVICHQVNCQGVMGSGIAKQVRERYPWVYGRYKWFCTLNSDCKEHLLGSAQHVFIDETRVIVNLFAQENFGYDGKCYTDYDALRECLRKVNQGFKGRTVAIPYLMGCHRGGGDWDTVQKMVEETMTDCDVTLYRYSEPEKR